jgi:hypothetical protein
MNDFAYLAEVFQHSSDALDPQALSLKLAETPLQLSTSAMSYRTTNCSRAQPVRGDPRGVVLSSSR